VRGRVELQGGKGDFAQRATGGGDYRLQTTDSTSYLTLSLSLSPSSTMGVAKTAVKAVLLAVFVYYLPYFVLYFNSLTPFKIVHTDAWKKFMDFRRSFRPEMAAVTLPEIDMKDLTYEKFMEMTNGLARPITIRNALPAVKEMGKVDFWIDNYGNSTINCVDMDTDLYRACTIKEYMEYNLQKGRKIYSRTNHQILYENPELLEKLTNNVSKWVGEDPLYEIFIGFESGASPLHAAFGVFLSKQITGRKKWTLWAPSELPWMDLHLSDDAASLLAIGGRATYSNTEWIKRTHRFETYLNAGDMLFNPCMWMHIVENVDAEAPDSLIIGSPERFFGVKYGWRTSSYITTHLIMKKILIKLYQKMMGIAAEKSAVDFLPINNVENARLFDEYIRKRAKELKGGAELE
jgi:hypothetical protein